MLREDLRERLLEAYQAVREASIRMCEPLAPEDFQVQPAEEVSPPKWNLGHTSWFFWQFVLGPRGRTLYEDEQYRYFLNSYYNRAGQKIQRGRRGLVTRPTLREVYDYRKSIDERMERLISESRGEDFETLRFLVTTGLNHEQQHQELFHTEIKHIYYQNPSHLRPAYRSSSGTRAGGDPGEIEFLHVEGGDFEFGNREGGWCWDNELEVHRFSLRGFGLQDRLITNREYLEFMDDGGYEDPLLWLADGWGELEKGHWRAPLYWEKMDGEWFTFTLSGMKPVVPEEPVCHVSFHEAYAFSRWMSQSAGVGEVRIPSEREWEQAARVFKAENSLGNFVENGPLHPQPRKRSLDHPVSQLFGDVWEWTSSHYEPYPAFKEFPDNLSEYNGKFMNNQRVLRGGSCVTPKDHMRVSYRNFWPPATRFQFTGIRLARDEG